MAADEQSKFLQELADDLNSRNIQLPSFPDVVINIRTALDDPTCTSERLADVLRTDPVLVARLLMATNSAFHNRAGIEIVDLNLAISRLGFEVVRNTAITLAVEQIFAASEYEDLKTPMKEMWHSSLSLASMSFVLARNSGGVNPDSAFLCGLLHEIGKLYILTKAKNYPGLMGDDASLRSLQDDWYVSVGKSIIEAWGFSSEIANSLSDEEDQSSGNSSSATLLDVVVLAKMVLAGTQSDETDGVFLGPADKLNLNADTLPLIHEAFDLHAQSMRQSVGA